MNIAFFSHYFAPEIGAPSARIYDLAQNWLKAGHRVQVSTCFPNHPGGKLYPGYSGGRYMYEDLDGISVHRHWTYITPNKGFFKKTLGHVSFLAGHYGFSGRKLEKPDVAVGTSPTFFAPVAAAASARQFKIPFVMEVRDLWPAIFVELGVLKNPAIIRSLEIWEMAMYQKAARIVTVTEAFRQNLIGRGVPENKVATITNGADVNFWRPEPKPRTLEKELGLEGKFVALYIGAHGISQALARVVEAAEMLRDRPDVAFLFVGDGAEKDMLKSMAETKRLSNVIFHDPVPKERVKDFYALSDVCLVPLRDIPLFDTFIPSKMFEILSMGRPVLGSLRGEAAGILERSGGSVVTPPEDSQAMADAIADLADDPDRLKAMGEAGRSFVIDNYSRAFLAQKYAEVLKSAINESWWAAG